jgi:HD-like signal output (HDOD) protein/ActR/RegA family two-component response regulator
MGDTETRCRIVFVDDEPRILEGLRRMLHSARNEWSMTFVEGGAQALELMAREPVDVIVTDMRMPVMDGTGLLERVKSLHPRTIRLILSGRSDPSPVMKAAGVAHQYLSKPCDAETLKATIRRTRALNDLLHSPRLLEVVGRIRSLPTVPAVYQELMRCLRDPEASLISVAKIIAKDMGMSAMMLKLVNSAFFGVPQQTYSVQRAVSLLGVETVLGLVLMHGLFEEHADARTAAVDPAQLQANSELAAAAMRCVARLERLDTALADQAYVATLLQEIGTLVLATQLPEQYADVVTRARALAVPLVELETAEFGATHAEVGGYLLGLWGLPSPVVEGVAFHETPSAVPSDTLTTAALVHIGNRLASETAPATSNAAARPADEDLLRATHLSERWPAWLEAWRAITGGAAA